MIYEIFVKQTLLFILGARLFLYLIDVLGACYTRCTLKSMYLIFEAQISGHNCSSIVLSLFKSSCFLKSSSSFRYISTPPPHFCSHFFVHKFTTWYINVV